MRNISVWLVLLFFLSGCSSSKTSRTPLQECLITEGSTDLIVIRINRYVKEKLNYTKNVISVDSASNGARSENHLTNRGRVVECKAILKFDDGSIETGMIKNETWIMPEYSLSYKPNTVSSSLPTSGSPSTPINNGICVGNKNNCSGTSDDDYYEPYPMTTEDVQRNKRYMRNHKTYLCRTVSPSYAEGIKVREYIVLDPGECR